MSAEHIQDCPYCNAEMHLYINTVKKVFYCQKCGTGGQVKDLPGGFWGKGWVTDDMTAAYSAYAKSKNPPELPLVEKDFYGEMLRGGELLPFARVFLQEYRHVAPWLLHSLPIYSSGDGIVFLFPGSKYWQERRWANGWRVPKGVSGASVGITYQVDAWNRFIPGLTVILVEGVLDALALTSQGFNTAAILSKNLHASQAESLARTYSHAAIMLDADAGTQDWTKILNTAGSFFDSVRSVPLPKGDPSSEPEMASRLLRKVI